MLKPTNYIKHTIAIITLAIILFGCEEPYLNEEINVNEDLPVCNAVFSNLDKVNLFELNYAKVYGDDSKRRIRNARVYLESEGEFLTELSETKQGFFGISDGFDGYEVGKQYNAVIELEDGQVLRSEPTRATDSILVDEIFIQENTYTSLVKNQDGEYVDVSQYGVKVFVDLQQPTQTSFCRVQGIFFVHSQSRSSVTKNVNKQISETARVNYEITYDTVFDIYKAYSSGDFPTIKAFYADETYDIKDLRISPVFIPAPASHNNFSMYTDDSFVEFLVPIDVYSHEYEIYKYYSDVQEMLTAPKQIFDPIPQQINGNIYNESKPNSPVLGLFDVSTVSRTFKSVYVYVAVGYSEYRVRNFNGTVSNGTFAGRTSTDTVVLDTTYIK